MSKCYQPADSGCLECANLQSKYEALVFEQARIHNRLDIAEHVGDPILLRCLKLEAYQVTNRIKEARLALTGHDNAEHTELRVA